MPIAAIYGPDDFEKSASRSPMPVPAQAGSGARAASLPTPSLEWTPEVERVTAPLYERVKSVITPLEWPLMAPTIKAINELKVERDAVILAHNYQTPEIFHCVADINGDSLQLAVEATKVKASTIIQCGVHFMAETSKILNPDKRVLIPDSRAGCSLASSIIGADVRLLRERFPGVPVVAYVNTSADVKAEVDICCTSSNAVAVVESLNAPEVIFLPDQYLAKYVASQTYVKIIAWKGACEVHERFTGDELRAYREADPSRADHRASGMPARRAGRSRLHRLDRAHDQLGAQQPEQTRGDDHRMLDGRQCEGRASRCRDGAALQSLPAYEADHAGQDFGQPAFAWRGSHDRSCDRRESAPLGRANDQFEELALRPGQASECERDPGPITTGRCNCTNDQQLRKTTTACG